MVGPASTITHDPCAVGAGKLTVYSGKTYNVDYSLFFLSGSASRGTLPQQDLSQFHDQEATLVISDGRKYNIFILGRDSFIVQREVAP